MHVCPAPLAPHTHNRTTCPHHTTPTGRGHAGAVVAHLAVRPACLDARRRRGRGDGPAVCLAQVPQHCSEVGVGHPKWGGQRSQPTAGLFGAPSHPGQARESELWHPTHPPTHPPALRATGGRRWKWRCRRRQTQPVTCVNIGGGGMPARGGGGQVRAGAGALGWARMQQGQGATCRKHYFNTIPAPIRHTTPRPLARPPPIPGPGGAMRPVGRGRRTQLRCPANSTDERAAREGT